MDSIHRIEPKLLTVPQFYGSPGEPQLTYPTKLGGRLPELAMNNSYAPLMGGPLMLALMAASGGVGDRQENRRSVSGTISRPEKKLRFDDLSFGKAFALARRIGLDQFTWNGNPYTTKLK